MTTSDECRSMGVTSPTEYKGQAECPICWDAQGSIESTWSALECGHVFHTDCLRQFRVTRAYTLAILCPQCQVSRSACSVAAAQGACGALPNPSRLSSNMYVSGQQRTCEAAGINCLALGAVPHALK
jgi:hypothetical protein